MRWQVKLRHEGDGKLAMERFLLQQWLQKLFRSEGCTSLLERRTELKGWEAGIILAFPKGPTCILNLGKVNIQGSVWGLVMFIRDLSGEASLQQDVLGPDSQWVSHPRTWGCGGYNLENDAEMCCHYWQVTHTLGYIRRNGAIQSRELLSPSTLACWGCTWNEVSNFWFPPTEGQKDAGKLKRVFLEDCQNVLWPTADVLGSVSWSLARKAEAANIVAVHPFPPISQRRHKIVLVLMNIKEQGKFLIETAGCACTASLEKGTTVKSKTNTNTFIGPTKAAKCVCFLQQAPRLHSGCFIRIKHHPESPGQFLMPPELSSVWAHPAAAPLRGVFIFQPQEMQWDSVCISYLSL